MPLRRLAVSDSYETYGTFCTPECCAAYLFDSKGRYGDSWKQYEMLHHMVSKMVNAKRVRIKLAPPRETLTRYGGPYNISKYRQLCSNYRANIQVLMPPVQPVQTIIEELPVDYHNAYKKFVPIDASRVERATTELRLKRKNKQSSENTLETFMRLRIS